MAAVVVAEGAGVVEEAVGVAGAEVAAVEGVVGSEGTASY